MLDLIVKVMVVCEGVCMMFIGCCEVSVLF